MGSDCISGDLPRREVLVAMGSWVITEGLLSIAVPINDDELVWLQKRRLAASAKTNRIGLNRVDFDGILERLRRAEAERDSLLAALRAADELAEAVEDWGQGNATAGCVINEARAYRAARGTK